ncbi:hypothetical protein [Sinosporangium siamense]|uniref:Guanylate cyclase domain-containing protein n=1 Tax=Sinosporangium siamense TaxID=1367973 RepID=A0A919RLZ5_9ACTN|nr:hypothetical protein [Sinosporangium siamense]GII94586.1 hypothetical protein Ssi02_48170 [Sinosporangium siamense]
MPSPVKREIRVMMSADIESYSDRNDAEQDAAQHSFVRILRSAARRTKLNPDEWDIQWAGDGKFSVLPAGTSVSLLTETFIQEFDLAIATHNARPRPTPWTRLRFRLSLHEGPVREGPTGMPGRHTVEVNRLLNADAARTALKVCRGSGLVVIVSERVFNDYLTDGYGQLSPTEFRPVRVKVKRNDYVAYLYVPGCELHEIPELDVFDPAVVDDETPSDAGQVGAVVPVPPSSPAPHAQERQNGPTQHIVYGSQHRFKNSNYQEVHNGNINVGDIDLSRRRGSRD